MRDAGVLMESIYCCRVSIGLEISRIISFAVSKTLFALAVLYYLSYSLK